MNPNEKQLLFDTTKDMDIPLTEEMLGQFMVYQELLLDWNTRMNLTSITDKKEIVLKHFADSLSPLPFLAELKENAPSVIDVGTGAGFPGIPLKIALPNIELTLLDSLQKRITFLETVCTDLALENVHCIHGRAEEFGKNPEFREGYDFCVSRAVAHLSMLLEYTLPFLKVGGKLIALKGQNFAVEVEESQEALAILGGVVKEVKAVNIPNTDLQHQLIFIEKVSETPEKYPRTAKKMKQKML
ncbi:MAG: 16S rRNA (guanine(527)-N(7))-methyltransferase RsmG [Bacillota bacterium]